MQLVENSVLDPPLSIFATGVSAFQLFETATKPFPDTARLLDHNTFIEYMIEDIDDVAACCNTIKTHRHHQCASWRRVCH